MDAMIAFTGGLIVLLIACAIGAAILYFVVKAAVFAGIKEAMWNLEISMRNAVKAGVQEAQQDIEKRKIEDKDGREG